MPASPSQRFTFDLSFDSPHSAAAAARTDDERTLRYSDDDLARVRLEAIAEGRAAGYAAALQEREQRMAESLQRLGQSLKSLGDAQAASIVASERDSLRLAGMLVRKIAPHLIAQGAIERIEALVREILPKIHDEPRIVIRLAEDLVDLAKDRIDAIARGGAFEGRIIYLAQPDMKPGDCLIEWADGGVEKRSESFLTEIDSAIGRFLSAPALSPVPVAPASPVAAETH